MKKLLADKRHKHSTMTFAPILFFPPITDENAGRTRSKVADCRRTYPSRPESHRLFHLNIKSRFVGVVIGLFYSVSYHSSMGVQVPATWQGIPGQPQLPTTPQQIAAPGTSLQQPGIVFPIQQYQVMENFSVLEV